MFQICVEYYYLISLLNRKIKFLLRKEGNSQNENLNYHSHLLNRLIIISIMLKILKLFNRFSYKINKMEAENTYRFYDIAANLTSEEFFGNLKKLFRRILWKEKSRT